MPHSHRESAVFQSAADLPAAQRATFLDGACLGDPDLRQRLEVLLEAHDAKDSFLEPGPSLGRGDLVETVKVDPASEDFDEAVGQTLGRYKLLERLGEGGCGVVYVAEQTEPVRRRVALKVIKLGMDTKQVVARFEAERQALAMMDHPNIAKVLDAGMTDPPGAPASLPASDSGKSNLPARMPALPGRPYFVMELVRGIRITDYCDQASLSTRERLDLFIKVCHAIQHAHQKGIIHRDIKPSNILVTLHDGVPVPKVIDFGIAKATEGRLTDATVYTQLHQFIGTPAYMSPEQAEMSGLDIDTRSDIYSLGVLLYELLAGSTPFDTQELMASGIDAMRKAIREKEPPRPSTRLATLAVDQLTTTAKRRSSDTSKLLHQLKGDLDWIVMKCLEKDRSRRYETANGLAADLKRHLDNEPVTARPPSAVYRLQKAWRRNKVAYTAGMAVVVALVIGMVASVLALIGQSRALKAERATSEARQVADVSKARADSTSAVVEGMLAAAIPELLEKDNGTAIRVVMDAAERQVAEHLRGSPIAEFNLRWALRDQFVSPGMWQLDGSTKQIQRMEDLFPKLTEEELPAGKRILFQILAAGMHAATDDFEGGITALRTLRKELESVTPIPKDLIVETLIMESDARVLRGQIDEAARLLRVALTLNPDRVGNLSLTKESPAARLANVLLQKGEYEDALTYARSALAGTSKDNHEQIIELSGRIVHALCGTARYADAESFIKEQEITANAWDEDDRRGIQLLTAHVRLAQGRWNDSADFLIKMGLEDNATCREWQLGAFAAKVKDDSEAYSRFVKDGLEKYYATADTQSAYWLFGVLVLQPQSPDIDAVAEELRQRLEKASYGWWTPTTLLGVARRSIHHGRPQEALDTLDRFSRMKDLRGVAALVHRQIINEERHQFIRAVALAELGRIVEARDAFLKGWTRIQSGPPSATGTHGMISKYLSMRISRQWAAAVLTAKGIELPEDAILP